MVKKYGLKEAVLRKMKAILTLAALILFASCKKCATCSSYTVSSAGHQQIYTNEKFCGDDLNRAKAENGKYVEYRNGGNTERVTTVVTCDN